MVKSLALLFVTFAEAKSDRELRSRYMDTVGEYFGVQRWGISFFDEQFGLAAIDVRGMLQVEAFLARYEEVGRAIDPVRRYVMEHHAPAHEAMVLPPDGWKQCELYKNCCGYYDHEHIMTGPIVGKGKLIGIVNFARVGNTRAFDADDIADLSAICLHLSACLASLRSPLLFQGAIAERLTKRERQIAYLVAQGMTNAQIGAELWIQPNSVKQALKRMFAKLEVNSRVEMVAKLQDLLR
jgi:DNA-binding CsgD family transcriptional regulator